MPESLKRCGAHSLWRRPRPPIHHSIQDDGPILKMCPHNLAMATSRGPSLLSLLADTENWRRSTAFSKSARSM